MRECVHENGRRTDPDGRHEWRAWRAAKGEFGHRAGFARRLYEVHGAFRAPPACARLRDLARKCSTSDTSRPRGRLKCRRVLSEFGKRVHMRAHVRNSTCCMPRVLFAGRAEQVSRTIRSCWPEREAAQVQCAGDVIGTDLAARVTVEQRTLARVGNPSEASARCD